MATGIFFNYYYVTHSLELEMFDKPTVWRALVDGRVEVFFEASTECEVLDLIDLAIKAWVEDAR